MKRVVLIYGVISGAIIFAMFMITWPLYKNGLLSMDHGEILGYTTMVIALSLIFFGVKSFRDNHLHGAIPFGRAFVLGLSIAGVASLFYAISWEIIFNLFMPDFMDQYANMCIAKAKAGNATEAELQKVMSQIDQMRGLYKNPFLRFGVTMAEILPVGILVALISAAILRKKEVLPA